MSNTDTELFDVCIVGAGIAGSTCAFYLAKLGVKTLVLDKQKFPRDKICGDAITARAQIHLERMGVLQKVLAEGKGHWAAIGGLVSPGGISYIGDSSNEQNHLVIAIKRKILDDMMIHAAVQQGAVLVEEYRVSNVKLSNEKQEWTISSELTFITIGYPSFSASERSSSRFLPKLVGFTGNPVFCKINFDS